MKDGDRRPLTKGALLKVWEGYFKELLNRGRSNSKLELPCCGEGEVEVVEMTDKVHTALKRMNKGRAPGILFLRMAAWLPGSYHFLERGCAADAVPLYQYNGIRFVDLRRMTG